MGQTRKTTKYLTAEKISATFIFFYSYELAQVDVGGKEKRHTNEQLPSESQKNARDQQTPQQMLI